MVIAIVQARMGSHRLPGKSMALIAGVPLVEHVLRRTMAAKLVDKVVLATTTLDEDKELVGLAMRLGVASHSYYDPDDVLSRFFHTSQAWPEYDVIVRITADDFAVDPALIDYAVRKWWSSTWNYIELGGPNCPLGLGVEVFARHALVEAHKEATTAYQREHVTPWIQEHMSGEIVDFIGLTRCKRFTIDTSEDLEFARGVYAKLYPANPLFGYRDLLEQGY